MRVGIAGCRRVRVGIEGSLAAGRVRVGVGAVGRVRWQGEGGVAGSRLSACPAASVHVTLLYCRCVFFFMRRTSALPQHFKLLDASYYTVPHCFYL